MGSQRGDIPIQFPPRYHLTINAAAANGLDLAVPRLLLDLADRGDVYQLAAVPERLLPSRLDVRLERK